MPFYYETKEYSKIESLVTHYYKTTYQKLKTTMLEYAKQNGFEIVDVNDEYKEACIKNKKFIINIKFSNLSVLETSIDFNIEVDMVFSKKNTIKLLNDIYEYLAKNHQFIGVGIHAN